MEGEILWILPKKGDKLIWKAFIPPYTGSWKQRHKLTAKGDMPAAFCWNQRQLSLYVVTPTSPVATTPPHVNICGSSTGQKATAEAEWKNRKEGLETIRRKGRAQTELTTVAAGNPNSGLSTPHLFARVDVDPRLYWTPTAASLNALLCKQQLRSP